MPRSGPLGTYTLPPGTAGKVPGDKVPSSGWNDWAEDMAVAFNTPTPMAYGGTDAGNPADARTNLGVPSLAVPTWTPALLFGGNNSGMVTASAVGYAIQIEDIVIAFYLITLSNKGVSTGVATISNLPVTAAASFSMADAAFLNSGGFSALTGPILATVVPAATSISLRMSSATGSDSVTDANFTNTSSISGKVIYRAA